jgi:hypothetical protein
MTFFLFECYSLIGIVAMSGRKKVNRSKKKHTKRQKVLNLMTRMKKKGNMSVNLESGINVRCSEADVYDAASSQSPEVATNTLNNNKHLPNSDIIPDSDNERKHLEEVRNTSVNTLEKRKIEFSSFKRATKRSRTCSLNRTGKKDLKWPKRISSTSCLTSWPNAAEEILLPSPMMEDVPKAKRSHDEVSMYSEDTSLICQPVKKAKSIESSTESLFSSAEQMMEISPVLTCSNKRTRHNSDLNNSFASEKFSEPDDSPPILRPKKRTKSVSGILPQAAKEPLKLLSECSLTSQQADLYMTPTKTVTPPENMMTVHIPATSPEDYPVAPQFQLKDNNSSSLESFLLKDAQNRSLQKVC